MSHRARLEIRLPEGLKADVKRAAAKTGEDVSDFVRVALLAAVLKYPAPTPKDLQEYHQVRRELQGAAHNLNHLAYLANQSRLGQGTMPDVAAIQANAVTLVDCGRKVLQVIRLWI